MSLAMPAAVHSLDRFVVEVPDLAEAERFYTAFGLDVRRQGAHLELRSFGHPHCWAELHAGGERKRLQYLRWGMHAADEAALRARVAAAGCAAEPHPLGTPDGIWLRNPDGVAMQIVVAPKVSPSAPTQPKTIPPVAAGHGAAPARSQVAPVRPRYLSHILCFSAEVPRMVAFCEQVLGLRLSDGSQDIIAFLHTPHGSDHHLIAFAKSHAAGLHHSSWDVGSVDEVGHGMEQMRAAGWGRGWGVGRHVLGSNYFCYVQDPWGSFAEYSAGIDYVPAGLQWPTADHPPEDSLFVWGPPVPEDFVTNHEQPLA
jgi:catechol 2,3-dioxygenase-like lactoylglutathione lyase family enzyme